MPKTEVLAPMAAQADDREIELIDAQVHVWLDSTPGRPWPDTGVEPQRIPPLGVAELLASMDATGVRRALLVPPTWEGPRNDLVIQAAADHPDRFAALGRVDPTRPEVVDSLAAWRANSGMLGIRLSINRGDRAQQVRAAISSGFFAAAEAGGVPISLYMPGSFEEIDALARLFPALKITVDHLGLDSRDLPLAHAIGPLLRLAERPNVAVKASALPCFIDEPYPFPSIAPAVYALVGEFGADRVFWGSDLSRLPCTYAELVTSFVDYLPELSEREHRLVMGGALASWLSWPLDSARQHQRRVIDKVRS